MDLDRTVEQFTQEIEHLTGVKIRIRWMPFYGLFLEDSETLNQYPVGAASKKGILAAAEQESICRGLYREHWLVLLGLSAPREED